MRLSYAIASAVICVTALVAVKDARAQSEGITVSAVLPPYDANAPKCAAPPASLNRKIYFLRDNDRQFMQGVARGLTLAAQDRKLDYAEMSANNDPVLMVGQMRDVVQRSGGAVVVAPIDPATLSTPVQEAIRAGTYVGSIVPPPAVSILNAPQYLTGKTLGDAAAEYIRRELKGKARVVLLTHDTNQFLARRFVGIRKSLEALPDAKIVADISPQTVDEAGGAAIMQTILLAHEEIDVVLGADTVVLGALKAMRAAGLANDRQFFGGIDGEPEAIEEIRRGGPYKTTISLASPVFSYAMGQQAADWLEGRSIPQAMDILPTALTRGNLATYQSYLENPAKVYDDPKLRSTYLAMYGNICFETRDRYLNFPWSSEP